MKTIRDAAQAALDVQNACNLSGVVYSFAEAMKILRASPECQGTKWANEHPIAKLFAVQVGHLTGMSTGPDSLIEYERCSKECEKLASEIVSTEGENFMSVKDIGYMTYATSDGKLRS